MIEFWIGVVVGGLVMAWLAWTHGRGEAGEQCILGLLAASEEPMYGLDMVEQSGGALSRGTVYVLLGRLEDRGLVAATDHDRDGRRRYRLASSDHD